MRIGIVLALLFACAAPAAAATQSIPFDLRDNRIVLHCKINGVGDFAMIFDTGASGVLVTPQAAGRLHLQTKPYGYMGGAGSGKMLFEQTQLQSVALGDLNLGPQRAFVASLDRIRRGIGFAQLDGIVGYDTVRSFLVGIDMDRRTMTISRAPIPHAAAARSVPLDIRGGYLYAPAAINGAAGEVILDTGDRSSLTLFAGFARAHGFYSIAPSVRDVLTGYGVGGPIRSDVFRTRISIFGFSVPKVITRASRDAGGIFATSSDAGSVGEGFLKRFNVIYDGVHHTMTLWPSRDFSNVDRYDPAGMWISAGESGPIVTSITQGGPAQQAGLQTQDTILALNGTSTRTWLPPQMRAWFARLQNGTHVDLLVQTASGSTQLHHLVVRDAI